jgi:hypothetical protein
MLNTTGGGEFVCPAPNQLARRLQPTITLSGASPGFRQGRIKVKCVGVCVVGGYFTFTRAFVVYVGVWEGRGECGALAFLN